MNSLLLRNDNRIKQALIDAGVFAGGDRDRLERQANDSRQDFYDYIVDQGMISAEALAKTIASLLDFRYVDLTTANIRPEALNIIPHEIAQQFRVVPFGRQPGGGIMVAFEDPSDLPTISNLNKQLKIDIIPYMAARRSLDSLLQQRAVSLRLDDEKKAGRKNEVDPDALTSFTATTIDSDSQIARMVEQILKNAYNYKASDIHIEPSETQLRIRMRIDGTLRELTSSSDPNQMVQKQIIARIKVLSNLRTDQTRNTQDGQFRFAVTDDHEVYFRVATSPVVWGEKAVLRLLDKTGLNFNLQQMGYSGRGLDLIKKAIGLPNGMILTSGPTGSGKTTSMYALLNRINQEGINIVTLENPVEYKIDGINQIEINEAVGLTFSAGLRSVLRGDPDVILVGEIRDEETANLAVQAAMTGHLVLSTIHTNSAAGILPRMINMGVEPFLIASTVRLVIGQRLARRINPEAGVIKYGSSPADTDMIRKSLGHLLPTEEDVQDPERLKAVETKIGYDNLPTANDQAYPLFKSQIGDAGYKGRVGLYEIFAVSEPIQEIINGNGKLLDIQRQAMKEGMLTIRQDGLLKAMAGMTTLDEINRITSDINM